MNNKNIETKQCSVKEIDSIGMESSNGNLKFIASKEIVDRDGDIIYIDGIDTKNFSKNPVFLWGHDSDKLPIGKIISTEKVVGVDGIKMLMIEVEFHKSVIAQEIKEMYDTNFLNAVSVRILPKSYEFYKDEKNEGIKFVESELIEVSAVTLPSNQEALIQRSLDQAVQIKRLEKEVSEMKSVYEKIETITETLSKFYAGSGNVGGVGSRIENISKKLQGEKNG